MAETVYNSNATVQVTRDAVFVGEQTYPASQISAVKVSLKWRDAHTPAKALLLLLLTGCSAYLMLNSYNWATSIPDLIGHILPLMSTILFLGSVSLTSRFMRGWYIMTLWLFGSFGKVCVLSSSDRIYVYRVMADIKRIITPARKYI